MDDAMLEVDVDAGETVLDVYERHGWGDGLPLEAPTAARVAARNAGRAAAAEADGEAFGDGSESEYADDDDDADADDDDDDEVEEEEETEGDEDAGGEGEGEEDAVRYAAVLLLSWLPTMPPMPTITRTCHRPDFRQSRMHAHRAALFCGLYSSDAAMSGHASLSVSELFRFAPSNAHHALFCTFAVLV